MNTNTQRKALDPVEQLDKTLTQLQEQRTQQLAEAGQYQAVEQELLDREHARLRQKYGDDHPRLQTVAARLKAGERLSGSLDEEVARSKTRQAPLPDGAYRIQGRVFDAAGKQPQPNLTVYLADVTREPQRDLGFACTDEQGFYALTIDEKQVRQEALYLTVADANQKVLCRNKTRLRLAPGTVEVRDLYIGKDGCTDPFDVPGKEKPVEIPVEKPTRGGREKK